MEHRHDYETVQRPGATPEAGELGITGVEIRQCRTCGHKMAFILVKERWVPLFEDTERGEQDILMA